MQSWWNQGKTGTITKERTPLKLKAYLNDLVPGSLYTGICIVRSQANSKHPDGETASYPVEFETQPIQIDFYILLLDERNAAFVWLEDIGTTRTDGIQY